MMERRVQDLCPSNANPAWLLPPETRNPSQMARESLLKTNVILLSEVKLPL